MAAPDRDYAQAKGFIARPGYRRHRPEATLLYGLVAGHLIKKAGPTRASTVTGLYVLAVAVVRNPF